MAFTKHTWTSGEVITSAKLNALETALEAADTDITALSARTNTLLAAEDYTPTWTIGSYINASGNVSSSTAGEISNVITLHKGEAIVVKWSEGTSVGIGAISSANSDRTYTVLVGNGKSSGNTEFRYTCTVDSIDIVFSALKTMTVTVILFRPSPINVPAENISGLNDALPIPWELALDRVLCIGDSLTAGVPPNTATMPNPMLQNYPYYLGRMISTDVTNGGLPGATTKDWFANKYSSYDMTEYNAAIICLGTNGNLTDTLDSDVNQYNDYNNYADTLTGYYCRLIESILHDNNNCMIVLVNIWSVAAGADTTRSVIRQIGEKYGLPVVETYDFRYAESPAYHGGIDNVHLTKAGYLALANRIRTTLRGYYNNNMSAVNIGMTAQN